MTVGTLAALGVFLLALFKINPQTAGLFGFVIFYASLLLTIVGGLAILGFIWQAWFRKKADPHFRLVKKSFRQAVLLALLLIIALGLQSQRYLNWWATAALVIVFTTAEIVMLVSSKERLN